MKIASTNNTRLLLFDRIIIIIIIIVCITLRELSGTVLFFPFSLLTGGIHETQLMLDFCGRHNIVCDIELIKADQINAAYERTINSDVKYRFVIDTASI